MGTVQEQKKEIVVYLDPSYDYWESYQIAPTFLLYADRVVFYGVVGPSLRCVRQDGACDEELTRYHADLFRHLALPKEGAPRYSVVVREPWYNKEWRRDYFGRRIEEGRPHPAAVGVDPSQWWTAFDDEMLKRQRKARIDLSRPVPLELLPHADSSLLLLPDEFNRKGREFIDECSQSRLFAPFRQAVQEAMGGAPWREPMVPNWSAADQFVHDVVNDHVAMAASGSVLQFIPDPYAAALLEVNGGIFSGRSESAEPPSSDIASLAERIRAAVDSALSVSGRIPARVTNERDWDNLKRVEEDKTSDLDTLRGFIRDAVGERPIMLDSQQHRELVEACATITQQPRNSAKLGERWKSTQLFLAAALSARSGLLALLALGFGVGFGAAAVREWLRPTLGEKQERARSIVRAALTGPRQE